jgi:hypothetical protein
MRGRLPAGPEYVDKLDGSAASKERLRVILETLAGRMRVQEACRRLGIGEGRFHQLREEALQGALATIEPRPPGRPSARATPEPRRIDDLEWALEERERELLRAQVREEVALILPCVALGEVGKKIRRRRVKLRKLPPR